MGFRRVCALRKNPSPLEKAATKIPVKIFALFDFQFFIFSQSCQFFAAIKYQDSSFVEVCSFFNAVSNFKINVNDMY
jgi:hypothetical protein